MIVEGPDGQRIDFGDATPEQIKAAMVKRYGAPKATQAAPAAQSGPSWGDRAIDALPAIGGTLGGIGGNLVGLAAGPGAPAAVPVGGISGAVVGGSIGERARQLMRRESFDMNRVAKEGAVQGGYQAIGGAIGHGIGMGARAVGPMAERAAAMMANPVAQRLGRYGLPLGGAMSHGIPGAIAGAAIPFAGKAAMNVAMSPRTEALLTSTAFQRFAKSSPRAAAELYKQMVSTEEPDATGGY
jgi:hypothetical protein